MSILDPSLLTDFEVNVIVAVVSGAVCLSPIGTKIKDWVKGVPSELRTALNNVETDTATKLKSAVASAEADVFSKLPQPAAKKVALPAPAAPVAAAPAATVVVPAAAPAAPAA
jgi:hypothetical protein